MCDICTNKAEKMNGNEEIGYRITPKGLLSLCTNDGYERLKSYMERNSIKAIVYENKELHWTKDITLYSA